MVVFHVDLRYAVISGRQEEAGIETNLKRPGLQLAVPVRTIFATETQVPLPDDRGGIPGRLEHVTDAGDFVVHPKRRTRSRNSRVLLTERVSAGQERPACWGAGRCGAVTARETHSFSGQLVDIWRFKAFSTVAGKIPVTQIVCHDDNYVGFLRLRCGKA